MSEQTKIEWCDYTFNPWIGCTKVASGCEHCYAEEMMATRFGKVKWGPQGTRSKTSDSYWSRPPKWGKQACVDRCPECGCYDLGPCCDGSVGCNGCEHYFTPHRGRPPRVFCASLADIFEDWQGPIVTDGGDVLHRSIEGVVHPKQEGNQLPANWRRLTMDDLRRDLFCLIDSTPNLDWILLTKRPENIREMWPAVREAFYPGGRTDSEDIGIPLLYRKNVWLMTSVSDQPSVNRNLPLLLECRDLCYNVGVSAEPLLGPIDLRRWQRIYGLGWVLVGGESGQHARTCDVDWIRHLRDQCANSGVPCFIKQLGTACRSDLEVELSATYSLSGPPGDPKGGDPDEWPEDLRVREFPRIFQNRIDRR